MLEIGVVVGCLLALNESLNVIPDEMLQPFAWI